MGNCLSKYPKQFELFTVRERGRKGPSLLKSGPRTEEKARSLGGCIARKNNILTPLNDRFPPQAFDLEVEKFACIKSTSRLCQIVSVTKKLKF